MKKWRKKIASFTYVYMHVCVGWGMCSLSIAVVANLQCVFIFFIFFALAIVESSCHFLSYTICHIPCKFAVNLVFTVGGLC